MMTYKTNITLDEIQQLPLGIFEGGIALIDSEQKFDKIIDELLAEPILGFDTETKPNFQKGGSNKVALLQLASPTKAYLIRLNFIGFPLKLKKVFESPDIIKVGVAIKDDLRQLKKHRPFEPKGFIELQEFTKDFGIQDNSLKKLAAIVLGLRVSKTQRVTNWESHALTDGQVRYAATDAWIPLQIYTHLETNQ